MKHDTLSRKEFIKRLAAGGLALSLGSGAVPLLATTKPSDSPQGLPNIILINVDDLGYGDLGCYGGKVIRTPNIDSLASEGIRFTDFHACDSVCSPSRAGLLTGRYPKRMDLDRPILPEDLTLKRSAIIKLGYALSGLGVMDSASGGGGAGIETRETTIAEALKERDYQTGMVGKWHLGDYSQDSVYNPRNHGFDFYYGVPHSNDMTPFPLYRDHEELEAHITDQTKLTRAYTEEAVKYIERSAEKPFFLYFAHTFPHRPLFASEKFVNQSNAGIYGDVVEELDWSVGRILQTLKKENLDQNTLILFTSDNGPWYQGNPGPYRGRKGQSYEGGHRVPLVARWPGNIRPGSVCEEPVMNIDLFPTLLKIAEIPVPSDRIIDGKNVLPLFTGSGDFTPQDAYYFYHHGVLEGIRVGKWKYLRSINHYVWPMPVNKEFGNLSNYTTGPLPMLFDLEIDESESYNLVSKYPDIAKQLNGMLQSWEEKMDQDPVGIF